MCMNLSNNKLNFQNANLILIRDYLQTRVVSKMWPVKNTLLISDLFQGQRS